MGVTFFFPWEVQFIQLLQSIECTAVNALAILFTYLGEEYVAILFLGLFYWSINKNTGRRIALAASGALLSGAMLKGVFLRRRPYMVHSDIKCIRAPHDEVDVMSVVSQGYSFPSLHTILSTSIYSSAAMYVKKTFMTVLAVALPLIVGFSRIYLGVHYPTDVLLGWITGIIMMLMFYFLEKKYGYKVCFIISLLIGLAGFFYCRDDEFFTTYGVIIGLFLGFLYEEKHVNFEMSKKWFSCILRALLGVVIFAVVCAVLKLPVSGIPEGKYVAFQFAYRILRYAASTFTVIGLYPHLFKKVKFLY